MIHISGGPGTGKTKKLLEKAQELNATVVCADPNRLYNKSLCYGMSGLKFLSYSDYIDHVLEVSKPMDEEHSDKIYIMQQYLIDDIGDFISYFSPETIGFTSIIDNDN